MEGGDTAELSARLEEQIEKTDAAAVALQTAMRRRMSVVAVRNRRNASRGAGPAHSALPTPCTSPQ